MVWSINLVVLAIGLFIVGMIKPNWILFWMEKPGRLPIVFLTSGIFMAAVIMFGEANVQKQKATASAERLKSAATENAVPIAETEIAVKTDEKVETVVEEVK